MTTEVRRMRDERELDALLEGDPDAWTARFWLDADRGEEIPYAHWFVAESEGRPVGFGGALRAPAGRDGCGLGLVRVLPTARRRGAGTALLDAVEQAIREADLPGLLLSRREGDADGRAAAAAWGLEEVGRHRESELDLTRIDRATFAVRAASPGVDLVALDPVDLAGDAPWERFHRFYAERCVETPDIQGGGEPAPYSVFRSIVAVHDPWAAIVAEDAGEWLGITVVGRRPGTDDVVNTMFTGTAPSARRRGIATALKCRQALLMVDAGISRIVTQNLDGNEPILAANRTLGFVETSGSVELVRRW